MNELDDIDRRLILELYKDGRTSVASLARDLKVSREMAQYRLKRLYTNEIIKNIVPVVNFGKLGIELYRLQLKFYHNPEKKALFFEYIKKIPRVSWLVKLQGSWELVISFSVTSNEEFKNIYDDILDKFGDIIKDKLFTIVTSIEHHIPNHALRSGEPALITEYKSGKEAHSLNDRQHQIIEELYKDGRMPLHRIAKNLGISSTTATYHYKLLKNDGIILSFRPILNLEKIGMQHFKVTVILDDPSQKKTFRNRLAASENVVYITHSIGKYDIEFETQDAKIQDLLDFIEELKEEFGIKEYDIIFNNEELIINRVFNNA